MARATMTASGALPAEEGGAEQPPLASPRRLRVPAPLAALLAAVFLLGVVWALITPAFQAPDENSHFGYLQSLADASELPGDLSRPLFSTEQRLAATASGADAA